MEGLGEDGGRTGLDTHHSLSENSESKESNGNGVRGQGNERMRVESRDRPGRKDDRSGGSERARLGDPAAVERMNRESRTPPPEYNRSGITRNRSPLEINTHSLTPSL